MQKPVAHWAPAVHGRPFGFCMLLQFPLPSQNRPCSGSDTHAGAPTGSSSPDGTNEHVPRFAARLHCLHLSLHPVSQQTPSTQLPVAHSLNRLHACPSRFLHCCAASHAWSEGQVSSGSPAGTLAQVPALPVTLHDRHMPAHWAAGCAQQTPSTQLPDMHALAAAAEHPAPLGRADAL